MLLLRFLRAMLGAGLGGAIWHFQGYFFEGFSVPYKTKDEIFIAQLIKVVILCMLVSVVISSAIALCRRFLQLEMKSLARITLGGILLASPLAVLLFLLYSPYHSFQDYLLHSLISLLRFLTVGGLAGLCYGNAGPEDENWMLSKTLVRIYQIGHSLTGKRDNKTNLSIIKSDSSQEK